MQLKDGSFVPKNNLTIQDLSEEYLKGLIKLLFQKWKNKEEIIWKTK